MCPMIFLEEDDTGHLMVKEGTAMPLVVDGNRLLAVDGTNNIGHLMAQEGTATAMPLVLVDASTNNIEEEGTNNIRHLMAQEGMTVPLVVDAGTNNIEEDGLIAIQ